MDTVTLNRADLRRADLSGSVLLNHRTHGTDAREAVLLYVHAPEHEKKEPAIGFEDADLRGAFVSRHWTIGRGTVAIPEDGVRVSAATPFPSRHKSPCELRQSDFWLTGGNR
jgi:uncharacterized protein YjbI with pentapeptide repeats